MKRHTCMVTLLAGSLMAGCIEDPASVPVGPKCAAPAPLQGKLDPRAPDYIVSFRAGVDTSAETARLAAKYDLMPTHVFQIIPAFVAAFSDEVREQLRCEPTVVAIEYDGVVTGG